MFYKRFAMFFYLAREDVFSSAVSISENGSSVVGGKSHVDAVLSSALVVGLPLFPLEVVGDVCEGLRTAPRPLTLTTLLRASGPVVEVVAPITYFNFYRYFTLIFLSCVV